MKLSCRSAQTCTKKIRFFSSTIFFKSESFFSKLSHYGSETGSHFAIHENYWPLFIDWKKIFLKLIYKLWQYWVKPIKTLVYPQKIPIRVWKFPISFYFSSCISPWIPWGWDKKCPRYHNFMKKALLRATRIVFFWTRSSFLLFYYWHALESTLFLRFITIFIAFIALYEL